MGIKQLEPVERLAIHRGVTRLRGRGGRAHSTQVTPLRAVPAPCSSVRPPPGSSAASTAPPPSCTEPPTIPGVTTAPREAPPAAPRPRWRAASCRSPAGGDGGGSIRIPGRLHGLVRLEVDLREDRPWSRHVHRPLTVVVGLHQPFGPRHRPLVRRVQRLRPARHPQPAARGGMGGRARLPSTWPASEPPSRSTSARRSSNPRCAALIVEAAEA